MKKRFLLLFTIFIVGCSGNELIDEKGMEDIIYEALITQAIRDADPNMRSATKITDSVDLYQPILSRRGYTVSDFQYTVREMSTRKSNPLNAILDRVVAKIDIIARSADENYGAFLRYDSISVAAFTDTIYRDNDTIKGSIAKYKIELDSIKRGQYKLIFDYTSTNRIGVSSKSIAYGIGDSAKNSYPPALSGVMNIQTNYMPITFSNTIDVERSRDTLNFRFKEGVVNRAFNKIKGVKTVKDTSYITRVRVVYMPFVSTARRDYLIKSSGLNKYIYKNENAQDSLSLYIK